MIRICGGWNADLSEPLRRTGPTAQFPRWYFQRYCSTHAVLGVRHSDRVSLKCVVDRIGTLPQHRGKPGGREFWGLSASQLRYCLRERKSRSAWLHHAIILTRNAPGMQVTFEVGTRKPGGEPLKPYAGPTAVEVHEQCHDDAMPGYRCHTFFVNAWSRNTIWARPLSFPTPHPALFRMGQGSGRSYFTSVT